MRVTGDIADAVLPLPEWSEAARLAALDSYAILDMERETAFNDIAQLAADIFDAPVRS